MFKTSSFGLGRAVTQMDSDRPASGPGGGGVTRRRAGEVHGGVGSKLSGLARALRPGSRYQISVLTVAWAVLRRIRHVELDEQAGRTTGRLGYTGPTTGHAMGGV